MQQLVPLVLVDTTSQQCHAHCIIITVTIMFFFLNNSVNIKSVCAGIAECLGGRGKNLCWKFSKALQKCQEISTKRHKKS